MPSVNRAMSRLSTTKLYRPLLACLAFVFVAFEPASLSAQLAKSVSPQPRFQTDPDHACASCHSAIYDAYKRTSMARGSGRATDGALSGGFTHNSSGVEYRVYKQDGRLWMSYDRSDPRRPLHGVRDLAFFVGSGQRGRTYLYQQDKLWFEIPINFYGKSQVWDMAPAYGPATSMPSPLPVDSNCLHCHTGQVNAAIDGLRNRYEADPFDSSGIGCAACHGDPASHLAAERTHSGLGVIVNPGKLAAAERDSACLQCHLEGDAAIYKPGRSLASYKPGDDLAKYVVYFVDASRPNFGDRASSQYEALLRSACKRSAGDKLTCTTCHDPHGSPAPEERVAFYRAKCLNCHTGEAIATRHHPEQQDCATCHMPTRNTADISHEQRTDHDIERHPPSAQDRQRGSDDTLPKATHLVVVGDTSASDRELGLAYAQIARKSDLSSARNAVKLLTQSEQAGTADAPVHTQLGFLEQSFGDKATAGREYRAALALEPHDLTAMADLAVLQAGGGDARSAIGLLQQVVDLDPSQTAAGLNLAFIECSLGRKQEAHEVLQRIRVFNPDDPTLRRFAESGDYAGAKCDLR